MSERTWSGFPACLSVFWIPARLKWIVSPVASLTTDVPTTWVLR